MADRSTRPVPEHVAEAARSRAQDTELPHPERAQWLDRFVWSVLWKAVVVAAAAAVAVLAILAARHLIGILVISVFFALAMIPGVNALTRRWHMRRGAAVGIIYLAAITFLVLMVAVLIPAITRFAEQVGANIGDWLHDLNAWGQANLGGSVVSDTADGAAESSAQLLGGWADEAFGLVTSGIGIVFDVFTIAAFSFYIAADYPRIMRAFMRRMPPARQQVFGWVADTSIEQTGGYFYSRLLLMLVNGGLAFVVMVIVGLPVVYALPLAVFMGFVSEFIPFIGTYIGAIVPILIVLGVRGLGSALVLTAWVVVYQQVENYVLSPRFSSKTMELNGAVAFGGALAGGAIAGPMGAFMALPVAALITAIVKNSGKTYDVVYRARYGDEDSAEGSGPSTSAPAPRATEG